VSNISYQPSQILP